MKRLTARSKLRIVVLDEDNNVRGEITTTAGALRDGRKRRTLLNTITLGDKA